MQFLHKHRQYLYLLLFYLAIALAYTYPLVTQFTTHTLGVDEDSATHVWYLWWFRWSILEGHSNPFWTNWIFYPQLINRTFDIHTWTNAILSLPFQYLVNVIAASNLVFLFSLVFSALGAFVLSFKLTGNKLSSVICGLIFGFFPFIFAQAEDFHTNLITVWFYPWYVWSVLRLVEKPSYKRAALAGLVLGLQILNDWTYTSFLLLSSPIIYFFYFLTDQKKIFNWRTIYFLGVKFVIALLIGSPLLIAAVITMKTGGSPSVPTWVQDYYGSDIAWYLTPSIQNPFLKDFASFRHISSVESTLYLGLINLALVTVALLKWVITLIMKRRQQKSSEVSRPLLARIVKALSNKAVLLPLLLFTCYFFLSLGPNFHFFDINRHPDPHFKPNLLMPFTYFQLIPFIGGVKEPARFAPFVTLGFALLVAFAFGYVTREFRPRVKAMLFTIVMGLILFEFYPGYAKTTDLRVPEVYQQIKADTADFAVLDLPVGFSSGSQIYGIGPIGSLQFYQTEHHHPIFRGTVARIDPKNIDYYQNIPLLGHLANPFKPLGKDDVDQQKVKAWFVSNKVKYVLVHEEKYKEKYLNANEPKGLIEKVLGAEKFYEKDNITGYKVY